MPDSTSLPGFAPLRNRPAIVGAAARVGRGGEPRWRDVQWIDFTSDPDSAAGPPPPDPFVPQITPKRIEGRRAAPELSGVLRHFARPAARSANRQDTIPGLAERFTRVPVSRLPRLSPSGSPVSRQPALPRAAVSAPAPCEPVRPAAPAKQYPVTIHPRLPEAPRAVVAKLEPPPVAVPEPETIRPPSADAATEPAERPFPASISTPVSIGTSDDPGRALRPSLTERGRAAATRFTGKISRVATRVRATRQPAIPRIPRLPVPGRALFAQLHRAANGIGRFISARENRLRISGLVTLSVIVVALVAYGGGALLASVTGPRAGAATAAAAKPAAIPEKPVRQGPTLISPLVIAPANVPANAPANAPSSEPAARAGAYMARAKAGDPAAQYDVGVLYARGDGLVQDYASAFSWFHAAAAQGNVAAQYNLGVLYAEGRGVPGDQSEALNWYRSAADQNHPGAQFNLALAYAEGAGTIQDYAAAARWYERAARQGLAPAMLNLAILYEQGSGVERSPVDAYAWYSAAAERGDSAAKQRAGALLQQFGDKDKARAQGLAATIAASLGTAAPTATSQPLKG